MTSWSEEKNDRRYDLIHKEVDGTINEEECAELVILQKQVMDHLNSIHPLPLPPPELLERLEKLEKAKQ